MIKITLPDGSIKEYEEKTKLKDIAADISMGLMRNSTGAVVNGEIKGLGDEVNEDAEVSFVSFDDEEGKVPFWHTSAHLLAHAVQNLYPDTEFAIGPAIGNGFYYDLDTDHTFVPEDLKELEKEMLRLAREDLTLDMELISRSDALKYFADEKQEYKVELIEDLPEDETLSLYKSGEFTDLCKGPHLMSTKGIKAIKLTSIAGAYWRGDENNKMLQRIYGISFPKKKLLDEYIERMEEAEKRDHRKLGKELDLFSLHEEGPGLPFFHPNGMIIRNELENFWKDLHVKAGYGEIKTPTILSESLWRTSGHWDHYKENMYFTKIDDHDFAIKPMNCPGSMLVYKTKMHSYRDLPLRMGELGHVHRHELSGTLHGLFRVRAFTQDDAHIFMLPEQIKDEIIGVIRLADTIYSQFGFKYSVELSTRPEDSMGSDEEWNTATDGLRAALEALDIDYRVDEGDGAFYGPKIDFQLEDAIGRTWQCGTIQLDFQLPRQFELEYVGEDGEKKMPVVVHRALYGSIERFLGILIEHYAGKFPVWLAPVQARILPISDKFNEGAYEYKKALEEMGVRVEVDDRAEKIGFKIREAQMEKIPYSLVVGEKELEDKTVSVRVRDQGEKGQVAFEDFKDIIVEKIRTKSNDLD